MIDIILVHIGNSDYLSTSLFALTRFSGFKITLLGDEANVELASKFNIRHARLAEFQDQRWDDIEKSYIHDSKLPVHFEKFCFLRFAAILRFVENKNIERFIYVDSDIVILNRTILDCMALSLAEMNLGCLTPAATFFSAWRSTTLSDFVKFLPSYFTLPAGGDRHCDMFALSVFIQRQNSNLVEAALARYVASYGPSFYFQDPNFSFSPILMKFSNVWNYREVSKKRYDIRSFIFYVDGVYVYRPFSNGPDLNIDFVHLNGDSKFYHTDFRDFLVESEAKTSG
jgi:hypothetical protein